MDKYDGEPVYIYGTGPTGKALYKEFADAGIHVHGFVDHLDRIPIPDVPVFKPEDFADVGPRCVIVLAVNNYQADLPAIIRSVAKFKKIVPMVELNEYFNIPFSGMRFWLTDRRNYAGWWDEIIKAGHLWKDEKSFDLYEDIIEYRRTGNPDYLPKPQGDLYHPKDMPRWKNPLRLVDCGAYTGDTLDDFIKTGYDIEQAVSFEPDPDPFIKLVRYVNAHGVNAICLPCGVSANNLAFPFEARGDMSSEFVVSGSSTVQCVAIDDCLPAFHPNLIKMDIEGWEMPALMGAQETIKKYHPGLAISVYHRPDDMWRIPLWVNEIAGGAYDFYLRTHSQSTFDTVMYAKSHE